MRGLCAGLVVCSLFAMAACGGSSDENLFSSGGKGGSAKGGASSGGANTGGNATGGSSSGGTSTGGAKTGGTGGVPSGGSAGVPSGGAAGAPSGGSAGMGSGGTGGVTLDNVCQTWAPKVCGLRKSCCTQAFGFGETQCVANETADCNSRVDQVKNGDRTFNPDAIDPCIAAVTQLYTACYFSGDQLAAFELAVNACDRMFDPTNAPPGTDCNRASDCTASTEPTGIVECNNGQCDQGSVVQSGGDCSGINICAPGFYCSNQVISQTCQPTTPVGGNCFQNAPCGPGYYCVGGHCATAQPGGSQCNSDLACLSLNCTFPGFPPGSCDPQSVYVSQSQCGV